MLDSRWVGPIGAEQDLAGAADEVGHVGQLAVEAMTGAGQVIDQDRSLDPEAVAKRSGVLDLLLQRSVSGEAFARVRFPGVDEDETDPMGGELPRHRLQRWRRQRAVGSGERAELDQEVAAAPALA